MKMLMVNCLALKNAQCGRVNNLLLSRQRRLVYAELVHCVSSGVAIYSQRSKPLSAWTKGYDLANLSADTDRSCLILETGVNQRWRYAAFRRSAENTEEAEAWEAAKSRCKYDVLLLLL